MPTVWQGTVGGLFRNLNREGPFLLVVGPKRVAELLQQTMECEEISQGTKIQFLIDLDKVTRPVLDWLHHHDLLLVTEADRVIAARA